MAAKIINASSRILRDGVNIVTGHLAAETLETVTDYSCPYLHPLKSVELHRRHHLRHGSDQRSSRNSRDLAPVQRAHHHQRRSSTRLFCTDPVHMEPRNCVPIRVWDRNDVNPNLCEFVQNFHTVLKRIVYSFPDIP
jgi:hypothetical protein